MALPPVLSPALSAKLSTLGQWLVRYRPDDELDKILAELATLPADEIVRASKEISSAARLGWWHKERDQRGRWSTPEWQLLRTNPNYAWLFLFHYDGFVREAALDAIQYPPISPFFFAALAWRLNDWVDPVRRAAERCAARVLLRASVEVTADAALYLLDRRLFWGRWRDEPSLLDTVFQRREVITAQAERFFDRSRGLPSSHLRHLLRYPNIDSFLPRLATSAIQPSVRAVAYRSLIAREAAWVIGFDWVWIDKVYHLRRRVPTLATRKLGVALPVSDLIHDAAHDRSAIVRRVAADALIAARSQVTDEEILIARLAKDESPSVRARADYLQRHPRSAQDNPPPADPP